MKILMLINGLYPESLGGVEKLGADIAELLAKKHDVVVYTAHVPDKPPVERRNSFLIKRTKSAADHRFKIPIGLRTVSWLGAIKKENPRPDVILCMSLSYGFICYLAKKLFGLPFLVYALGSDWYFARDRKVTGKNLRMGIEHCKTMITQTSIIRNDVLKYFPEVAIEVIPNGIELTEDRAKGDALVTLGRLNEVKGIRYLIEAVRGIEDCPKVVIGGAGPEEDALRKMAEGMDVEFTGRVNNVGDLFSRGKIFVQPSLSEGLPQTILEAMSYGLPVIATRVGGVPDVIEHGKTGFLIESRKPAEIKKYIEILMKDDTLRKEMSRNCLEEIQKYSWDKTIGRIEDVLGKAAASGSST